MLRLRACACIAASLITLALASACGGDSNITQPKSDASAEHFDSLYFVAFNSPQFGEFGHSVDLSFVESGFAFGGQPTELAVSTTNGVEHWTGVEYQITYAAGDANYFLFAYRDADAHTLLAVHYRADGMIVSGQITASDSIYVESSGSGETSIDGSGAHACPAAPSTLHNSAIGAFANVPCSIVHFHATALFDMPSTPGIDPSLRHLSFTAAFTGEHFTLP